MSILATPAAPAETFYVDPEFAAEKPGAQEMVRKWWPLMAEILVSKKRGDAVKRVASLTGVSQKRIRGKFDLWRHNHFRWQILVDRARYPKPKDAALPAAFVQHLCTLKDKHQRALTGTRAVQCVMAQLAAWELDPLNPELAIPGYDRPPPRGIFSGLPRSWSEGTLRCALKNHSNKYTDTLRKQGSQAASNFLPNVHTTRAEMYFGEVLYFDDDVLDLYVNLSGVNSKAVRPQAFTCLEAYSGSIFNRAFKPEIEKLDNQGRVVGKRVLNADDFFWFVMSVLMTQGYSKGGTTLVFEWGTANPDKRDREVYEDHFDNLIQKFTNGAVRVDRSGRYRDPAFKGMLFGSNCSGNFKFKAPVESGFNNLRNYESLLPGATGHDQGATAPEENYGMLQMNNASLKLIEKISPARFRRLRRPVLEWEDLRYFVSLITEIVDRRDKHTLEGYEKLGFRKQKYRLDLQSEDWMSEEAYQSLPADQRAIYDHIVCQPGYFRSSKMSPHDVKMEHLHELTRLPAWTVPMLAPPRMWKPCVIAQNLEIRIESNSIEEYTDSEDLIYIGKVRSAHGDEVNLVRGQKYYRLLNFFNPDTLWIAEANGSERGRFLGVCHRINPGGKMDHEKILEQLGNIAHIKTVESAEVRRRTTDDAVAARLEMREHNRAIMGEDKALTSTERKLARLADDALTSQPSAPTENLTAEDYANLANSVL